MIFKDIMKYIESEYSIINLTPCEVCGNTYVTENIGLELVDDVPYDVCFCTCEKCGHEKEFLFTTPFIDEEEFEIVKSNMN